MAYYINDDCISCGACEPECPNKAIREGETNYIINPDRCTECVGVYKSSRCAEVCPVDACHPDTNHTETKEQLLEKWRGLHPGKEPAAAAERAEVVGAVVSRGGRPDLAAPVLDRVKAPTLLIVGGNDFPVIDMNREALAKLRVEKQIVIVPGATHLFEEPGTLEQVAELARDWFIKYLTA
jgi:NAD-dependent dihydropyrimidine dehydrogenase PreA subunit